MSDPSPTADEPADDGLPRKDEPVGDFDSDEHADPGGDSDVDPDG